MNPLGIIFLVSSVVISAVLRSRLARYTQTRLSSNLSGAEVAAKMLQTYGVEDVRITCAPGQLTDHYNPLNKTVNLSHQVYHGNNAAAAAIAAHECGHAVQHAQGYAFLQLRSTMVPVVSVTSQLMPWIIVLGILLVHMTLIPLVTAVVLFALTTLFSFVTLPVEFDASKRALVWMDSQGVVTSQEHHMAKDALWWAAMTYVVAALGSLAELIRLMHIVNRSKK
jgi:Zn-dependent membrane protease YugP